MGLYEIRSPGGKRATLNKFPYALKMPKIVILNAALWSKGRAVQSGSRVQRVTANTAEHTSISYWCTNTSKSYARSNLITLEKLAMMISLFLPFTYQNGCFDWLSIIIHVGQVFDEKRFSPGKGSKSLVDCSLPGVQRFTTHPEGHKSVAWAPVLISTSFPITHQLHPSSWS